MKNIGGLVSLIGTLAFGTVVVVACGGDDVVNQTYTGDGGTSGTASGGTSGGTSSSGSGTSSGGASSSGGADDPVGAYAAAICVYQKKCIPIAFIELFGDEAGCNAFYKDAQTRLATLPGVSITPDQYRACAAKASAAACDDGTLKDCEFSGTLEDGKPCGVDAQCKGGSCVKSLASACGTCGTRGGDGAECGSNRPACQYELRCAPSTQKCAPPVAEGGDCKIAGPPCALGNRCVQGKCAKPNADGSTCTTNNTCSVQSFCSDANKCTAAGQTVANPGDPCADQTVGCKLGTCSEPEAKCTARAGAGEDCGNRTLCKAGLSCRSGKCTMDDPSACK